MTTTKGGPTCAVQRPTINGTFQWHFSKIFLPIHVMRPDVTIPHLKPTMDERQIWSTSHDDIPQPLIVVHILKKSWKV
jgi:hypothetical protein